MFWRTEAPRRRPVGFIEPCIPTRAEAPPAGPQWIHEIKHDGYRLIVCRRGDRVRLFTRRGYDWSDRYRLVAAAAAALPADVTIDGEVVVGDDGGVADFERLHSRDHDGRAFLWAFDLLELDGEDLRSQPLLERKGALRRLLSRSKTGIQFVDQLDGDGAEVFAHACKLGLEGIVSKDRTRPYRSGRTKTWLKIKNRRRQAFSASRTAMRRRNSEQLQRLLARLVRRIPKKPPAPSIGRQAKRKLA
jgi:ATP-dependent DNA ligase